MEHNVDIPLRQTNDEQDIDRDDSMSEIKEDILESESDTKPNDDYYVTRLRSVFFKFLPLGLFAFGGPSAYAILHERFVESNKWLNEDRFLELLSLCQALPGPSATQLVIAVAFDYSGYIGGIIAFFLWILPCFIIATLLGLGVNELGISDENEPDWMSGLAPSAISLVFVASFKLGKKCIIENKKIHFIQDEKKHFNILLVIAILSAIIILFVTSIKEGISNQAQGFVYPFVIFAGGLSTYCDSKIPFRSHLYDKFKKQEIKMQTKKNTTPTPLIEKIKWISLILIWLIVLFTFIILRYETDILNDSNHSIWLLWESLWRIGSITYGGGQVILTMLFDEVVETEWMTSQQFWTGFAISQILPGPLSCKIAAYIGALMYGVFGAFFAWIALFAPGTMLIFAFVPIMDMFKKWIWFQIMMEGINCAAIGLLVSACIKLWNSAVHTVADSCIVLITISLVSFWNIPTPIAIIIGGILGFIFSDTVLGIGQSKL